MGGLVVGFGAQWGGVEFIFLWVSHMDLRVTHGGLCGGGFVCFYGLRIFNASAQVSWTVFLWCLEVFGVFL